MKTSQKEFFLKNYFYHFYLFTDTSFCPVEVTSWTNIEDCITVFLVLNSSFYSYML